MSKNVGKITIIPVMNLPLIWQGDNLAELVIKALDDSGEKLRNNDVLVLSQKVVSKAEGNVVDLNTVKPSQKAQALAHELGKDPRIVHLVLKEAKRIVRKGNGVLIVEHKRGWVCADAGVDFSNVPGEYVTLLPEDPDASAEKVRGKIRERLGVDVAVVISDSQGRPFRNGAVGIALGCAGMPGIISKIGEEDLFQYKLRRKQIAIADEVASAALMVMGETAEAVPAAIVRGLVFGKKGGCAQDLVRSEEKDLFR